MGDAYRNPQNILQFEAESAVRDGDLVVQGAADYKVAFPGGASPTSMLLGVVMRPDGSVAASGDKVNVVTAGVYPVRAGGTITRGDLITSNGTDGTAKTEAAGAGVNVGVIGQALASGVSGDKVSVLIRPHMKQGA